MCGRRWRRAPARRTKGVRLALYFQRKAEASTSAYDILADPALLKVVQTALGIPAETGAQDIDKQAALIGSQLDLEDLKDPQKLDEHSSPASPASTSCRTRPRRRRPPSC